MIRCYTIALVLVLVLILAGSALAQYPNAIDTWSTQSGTMIGGRASEAWRGANTGECFDVCCITMAINCAVGNEIDTWGNIKAQYR